MAHLSYTEFKALTGKTSVTDWVKYNWISPQTQPAKRYWIFKYPTYQEVYDKGYHVKAIQCVRFSNYLYGSSAYSLATSKNFITNAITYEGVTHAINNTDYIMGEVNEAQYDPNKTLLENYKIQTGYTYTGVDVEQLFADYVEIRELTEEAESMYNIHTIFTQ